MPTAKPSNGFIRIKVQPTHAPHHAIPASRRTIVKASPRSILLAAALLSAIAAPGTWSLVRAATASSESDTRILAEIHSRILDARAGYFLDIEIDIINGDVLLTGRVDDPQVRTRAAALVRSVRGVGTVINEIRTEVPTTLPGKAAEIETERRISNALYRTFRKTLPAITWRVVGDTAYIFGATPSQWVHSRLFSAVKQVKGVANIVDHLRIAQDAGKR